MASNAFEADGKRGTDATASDSTPSHTAKQHPEPPVPMSPYPAPPVARPSSEPSSPPAFAPQVGEFATWVGIAAASGVAGNVAYDIIKSSFLALLPRRSSKKDKLSLLAKVAIDYQFYASGRAMPQWTLLSIDKNRREWCLRMKSQNHRFIVEVTIPNCKFDQLGGRGIVVRAYEHQPLSPVQPAPPHLADRPPRYR